MQLILLFFNNYVYGFCVSPISINITGGMDVASFAVYVTFDSSALSYVSIAFGGYLVSPVVGRAESTSDSVHFGEATIAGGTDGFVIGADGDGTLATVTFRVVEVKDSTVGLSSILANSRYNEIATTDRGARVTRTATETGGTSTDTPPMRLLRISGGNQQGLLGEALANPFVVEVHNQNGEPAEGVDVTFFVLTGGGSLSAETATTDSNGQAESTLTLGSEPGINRVQVSFSGINPLAVLIGGNSPRIVFSAEATTVVSTDDGSLSTETVTTDSSGQAESTPDPDSESSTSTVEVSTEATLPPLIPTTLEGISGDNQSGLTGETLANPFVVEVRDQNGDSMAGITVTFAATSGGGALSATTAMTDANGQAASTLTLGSYSRTNMVEASIEGVAETVTFSASAEILEFDLSPCRQVSV